MMPTFRQQLVKRRTLLGSVTLFCLLWHMLLPTMVHIGLVPALFVMPSHCQPDVLAEVQQGSTSTPASIQPMPPGMHMMMDGAMPDHAMGQMMGHAMSHHNSHSMSPAEHMHMSGAMPHAHGDAPETDRFHTQHAHEVFALAAKIMKHCPLCSHGLEGGILAPLIALVFVLLACWFAVVRCLCHTWTENKYFPRFSFILPFKHAPPVTL